MSRFERFRPDPIPDLHPMPEYLVTGQRAKWYDDTKQVLQVPYLLMEPHHLDEPTRAVYEDIKNILQLPFVNTDYRAFARWPSYFANENKFGDADQFGIYTTFEGQNRFDW